MIFKISKLNPIYTTFGSTLGSTLDFAGFPNLRLRFWAQKFTSRKIPKLKILFTREVSGKIQFFGSAKLAIYKIKRRIKSRFFKRKISTHPRNRAIMAAKLMMISMILNKSKLLLIGWEFCAAAWLVTSAGCCQEIRNVRFSSSRLPSPGHPDSDVPHSSHSTRSTRVKWNFHCGS